MIYESNENVRKGIKKSSLSVKNITFFPLSLGAFLAAKMHGKTSGIPGAAGENGVIKGHQTMAGIKLEFDRVQRLHRTAI